MAKPYLNIGAGRLIFPGAQPQHHGLVDGGIYAYPYWHNVDRNQQPGIDEVVDLFCYPWPWADNSFDGALLAHIVEHIPHEIKIQGQTATTPQGIEYTLPPGKREIALKSMQDGWYAFFYELWRVLTPGAIAHVLSPYAWSQGAVTDPTHTRLITEHTFTHSMAPDERSPFEYATGNMHWQQVEPARFNLTPFFAHLQDDPQELTRALQTRINVAYELYIKLEAVK